MHSQCSGERRLDHRDLHLWARDAPYQSCYTWLTDRTQEAGAKSRATLQRASNLHAPRYWRDVTHFHGNAASVGVT